MSLLSHAKEEFRAAGWVDENGKYNDDMQEAICDHVIKLLEVFSEEGHSGSTAPYAINLFTRLAKFEPITPLTGEDWEWNEVSERMGSKCWQNRRCSSIFKDDNGECYDIDGKVFWEWAVSYDDEGKPNGEVHKSYYTNRESRVPVTFPYTKPKEPIYEYRYSDAEPPQPPQTEAGLI